LKIILKNLGDWREEEIRKKIKGAFCPEGEVEFNPLLDWAKYLVFISDKSKLAIERPEKFGGNVAYGNFEDLEKDFSEKKLHPMDLKAAMADKLVEIMKPAMKHFSTPKLQQAKKKMEELIVTR
jgi:tyrosyl-tRNA synthetase